MERPTPQRLLFWSIVISLSATALAIILTIVTMTGGRISLRENRFSFGTINFSGLTISGG
jgi:multisubunit Na+/H+ antiporter MnhC subunit